MNYTIEFPCGASGSVPEKSIIPILANFRTLQGVDIYAEDNQDERLSAKEWLIEQFNVSNEDAWYNFEKWLLPLLGEPFITCDLQENTIFFNVGGIAQATTVYPWTFSSVVVLRIVDTLSLKLTQYQSTLN